MGMREGSLKKVLTNFFDRFLLRKMSSYTCEYVNDRRCLEKVSTKVGEEADKESGIEFSR